MKPDRAKRCRRPTTNAVSMEARRRLRFVSPTVSRPVGFTKPALCKVAYAGSVAGLHGGISQVLRTFTWPVAFGQSWVTAPLPTKGGTPNNRCIVPGLYVYLNHNLIEAVLLGAAAHMNVEGKWDDDIMKQLKKPTPSK